MRIRRIPRVAPRPGSVEGVAQHFDQIAEAARRRALASLRAQNASPARIEAELAKLDAWLAGWRSRGPHILAMHGRNTP
jgi:hypothetical protein